MQPQPRSDILKSMNNANINSPEIVTTPTFDWLAERARNCQSRMHIGSPYVTDALLEVAKLVPKKAKKWLITQTNLVDFKRGASNLDVLCDLAESGARIFSLNNLHAKIYIFDDSTALVTSANATRRGLHSNWECGFAIHDAPTAKRLRMMLLGGLGADDPPERIRLEELQELRPPVEKVEVELPDPSSDSEAEPSMVIPNSNELLESFKGWKKIALRGALELGNDDFGLQELYQVCEPYATDEYPDNTEPEAKLRQLMQFLRDHGLIKFLGGGRYSIADPLKKAHQTQQIDITQSSESLLDSYKGWQQIALRGALSFGGREFNSKELFEVCRSEAKQKYENNENPDAALRRELQKLRDKGVVEFLGNGVYRVIKKQ